MNILLKEAIRAQKLVEITSHGNVYLAEPYCYGKVWTGQEALRVYITDSISGSTTTGWHLFLMGDIQNFRVLPSAFEEVRTDFDAYDLAMFFIYCRVEKQSQYSPAPKAVFPIGTTGHTAAVRAYL